jgi:predicted secreted protein
MSRLHHHGLAAVFASAMLILQGCGGVEDPVDESLNGQVTEDDGKEDAAKPKTIKVTAAKDGKTVTARVGDTVQVRLEGNPTTGYQWRAVSYSKSCPVSDPDGAYLPSAPQTIGSGGTYVFTIKPDLLAKGGTFHFQFAYYRSWEDVSDAIKTFAFDLKVSTVAPWCSDGTIVQGAPKFTSSDDGMKCQLPNPMCVTKDSSACPQLSPLPPGWCSDGKIVKGAPTFITSADGMKCQMPSVVCVTKDSSACPQLSPLPPGWCSDGIIVQGAPKFIASADGKKCQMPSVVCVTKDASACPQL